MFVVAACGASNFDRVDAITSFQTSGASAAEATCMADTLIGLGDIDAADPRVALSDESRENLAISTSRCITVDVLGENEIAPRESAPAPTSNLPSTPFDIGGQGQAANTVAPEDMDRVREEAIASLRGFGRSLRNATCVVDQLITIEAEYLLSDPAFGLGLDPVEASAMAFCL